MSTEAELLANLPADGVRVWRNVSEPTWYRAVQANGTFWFVSDVTRAAGWELHRMKLSDDLSRDDDWTEITPAPTTPTLPDPSGDLPDGTRVRITYEGTTEGWRNSRGRVEGSGSDVDYTGGGTVEVLALPTPPPSALDGKPGSLWRDPETGNIWARTTIEAAWPFALISSDYLTEAQWMSKNVANTPLVARLVPAQVADDE